MSSSGSMGQFLDLADAQNPDNGPAAEANGTGIIIPQVDGDPAQEERRRSSADSGRAFSRTATADTAVTFYSAKSEISSSLGSDDGLSLAEGKDALPSSEGTEDAPGCHLLRSSSLAFRTVQKASLKNLQDMEAGKAASVKSLSSQASGDSLLDFSALPEPEPETSPSKMVVKRPSALSSEIIRQSSEEFHECKEPEAPTPIRRVNSQYVSDYIQRTETMQLQVLVHEMLRIEVTELLKEKSELAKKMAKLEQKEKLLMEEILKAENLLGEEVLQDDLVDGMPEDERLELGETGFDGLVDQYRSLLDGYHASKVQKTSVNAVAAYAEMLASAPQAALSQVLDGNCKWVKSHGWHLAGSHQGNSSQLYRLLAEEVGELLAELDRDADRAAHELGDVMAYMMQFIWEFHLQKLFPPSPNAGRKRWANLDKSFAQLQIRKAEQLAATAKGETSSAEGGRIKVRDILLRLHRCLLSLASSLRTVNGDHQRFQAASNWDKRNALAKDLDMLMESLVEVSVAYQLRLHDRADTGWLYTGYGGEKKPVRWVQSYQCQNKACGKQKENTKPLCQSCAKANQCHQCGDQKELVPDPDSGEPGLNGGGTISPLPLCGTCAAANSCKGCGKQGIKERPEADVFCPACKRKLVCSCGELKRDPSHAVCATCHGAYRKSMDQTPVKGKGPGARGSQQAGSRQQTPVKPKKKQQQQQQSW